MRKQEMYSALPTKGKYSDDVKQVILFTAVRPCAMENCPIYDLCPYTKSPNHKCKVEVTYLDAVFNSLCDIVQGHVDQAMMNKFTLHLLPLHQQLIKFKIKAYSIEDVCYTTTRGSIQMHPIFREIRDTIRAIEATQKSLGLDLEYAKHLGQIGKRPAKDAGKYGDPDYWDDWRQDLDEDLFPEGQKQKVTRVKPE